MGPGPSSFPPTTMTTHTNSLHPATNACSPCVEDAHAVNRGAHRTARTGRTLFATLQEPELPTLNGPVFEVRLVRERSHETAQIRTPADAAQLCCSTTTTARSSSPSRSRRPAGAIGAHVYHVGTVDASVTSPREVFHFCLLIKRTSQPCTIRVEVSHA